MREVIVNSMRRVTIEVPPEDIEMYFAPEPGLKFWSLERIPNGNIRLTFGREDRSEKLIGPETKRELPVRASTDS